MSELPALRAQLRRATAALHEELEATLDLLDASLSLERYRAVLGVLHGFYAPLEAIQAELARGFAPDAPLRDRSRLLARDLAALGTAPHELPRCRELPALAGVEGLAGSLYVVEGASLGGQLVARAVEARLGLTAARGAAFFVGAGPATHARWRSFLAWLEAVVGRGGSEPAIVEAACETFRALARWSAGPRTER